MSKIRYRFIDCQKCYGGKVKLVEGESLRYLREARGISIRAFAKRLGFSAPYLSDIELGKRACTPKILKAYSKL